MLYETFSVTDKEKVKEYLKALDMVWHLAYGYYEGISEEKKKTRREARSRKEKT